MPLCVFDIHPDGNARQASDAALVGPGIYRWHHYDLSDPDLAGWVSRSLDPIPAAALLQPETRPRCDPYGDGLILNLRGINLNEGQSADQMVSVRMWVAQEAVVTVRVRRVFALEDIRGLCVAGQAPSSPAAFLNALIGRLTARIQDEVLRISAQTEFFEVDLENKHSPTPRELPETRRKVIKLRRYLEPQKHALDRLVVFEGALVGAADALELRELANRTTIAVEELAAQQERIITVQDEHDLQVAQRQASHGFRLSLAAAVFLPISFLTGLFGVNVGGMPGLENPSAFAILSLSMVALAIVLVLLLKWIRWL